MTVPSVYPASPKSAVADRPVYIYALHDPQNDEIRYIGKSHKPRARLWQHLHGARRGEKTYRHHWIAGLLAIGLSPRITILETTTLAGWAEAERCHIAQARAAGCRLTNLTDGGDGAFGYKHTSECIEKMSRIANGRAPETWVRIHTARSQAFNTPEARANRSAAMKKRWEDPAFQQLRSKSARNMPLESRAEISKKMKAKSPEWHALKQAKQREAMCRPDVRLKISNAKKGTMTNEQRMATSQRLKEKWLNADFRERAIAASHTPESAAKTAAAIREHWQDPEFRAHMIDAQKEQWQEPDLRTKELPRLAAMREQWYEDRARYKAATDKPKRTYTSTPEGRKRQSEAAKAVWAKRKSEGGVSPETRAKMSAASKERCERIKQFRAVKQLPLPL